MLLIAPLKLNDYNKKRERRKRNLREVKKEWEEERSCLGRIRLSFFFSGVGSNVRFCKSCDDRIGVFIEES